MTEAYITLPMDVLKAIAQGNEAVIDLPDEDLRVYVRCDDATVAVFRAYVMSALLHRLTPAPGTH